VTYLILDLESLWGDDVHIGNLFRVCMEGIADARQFLPLCKAIFA